MKIDEYMELLAVQAGTALALTLIVLFYLLIRYG